MSFSIQITSGELSDDHPVNQINSSIHMPLALKHTWTVRLNRTQFIKQKQNVHAASEASKRHTATKGAEEAAALIVHGNWVWGENRHLFCF